MIPATITSPQASKSLRVSPDWAMLPLFDRSKWQRVRFGDVVRVLKEQVDPQLGEVERYVAGEHMISDDVHIRQWGTVGDGYLGPAFIRRFRKGHVLYGSRRTYLKKVAVAEWDGVTSNTTLVLEAVEGKMIQELLPWLMLSERFTKHSVQESKGSTNPYINWPDIAKFEFDVPPLVQQQRIAEILWALDETLNCYNNLRVDLEAYSVVALCEALHTGAPTGKSKSTNPRWDLRPLGDICELRNGRGFAASEWSDTGLPIIRIQNLNGSQEFNYFSGQPEANWIVEPGTLLFAWAGVRGMSFGPCIWPGPVGVLNQHIFRIIPNHGIDLRWLYETLRVITVDIEKKAHGFKIELVHARKGDITANIVPVPPLPEQKRIAEYAKSLEDYEGQIAKYESALLEVRNTLLGNYFNA